MQDCPFPSPKETNQLHTQDKAHRAIVLFKQDDKPMTEIQTCQDLQVGRNIGRSDTNILNLVLFPPTY